MLGLGYLPLGAVLIPTLAVPIAWVQYGPENTHIILPLAAAMMFWRHKNGLHRIFWGRKNKFSAPKAENIIPRQGKKQQFCAEKQTEKRQKIRKY